MHGLQRSGLKGGDHESPARLVPEKQVEQDSLQALDLQFDIEKRIAVTLENIPQPGQLGKLLRGSAGNLESSDLRVMADHRLFIGSEAHIEFKAVATVGQSLIKRG